MIMTLVIHDVHVLYKIKIIPYFILKKKKWKYGSGLSKTLTKCE